MGIRETQKKGDIAVASAIALFTSKGYDVLIPLTESAAYDLVVDTGDELKRVQVKFSTHKDVGLRSIHSNSKGYVVKKRKDNCYDWLYVLHNGQHYIVEECLAHRRSITMNDKYLVGCG